MGERGRDGGGSSVKRRGGEITGGGKDEGGRGGEGKYVVNVARTGRWVVASEGETGEGTSFMCVCTPPTHPYSHVNTLSLLNKREREREGCCHELFPTVR